MDEEHLEFLANKTASIAVNKTFAILGVDINQPKEVANFRRDLQFAGDLRRYASHGALAMVIVIAGALVAALWSGIKIKIGA